jgi:hypothetical protein
MTGTAGTTPATPVIAAVDHVQPAAPPGSEPALRAFYAGALGMTETARPPALAARGGCWFTAGAVALRLGVEAHFRPARKAHPGVRVTGVRALAERLRDHGVAVVWDQDLPGHQRFHCHDPVGNRPEFLEPVAPR